MTTEQPATFKLLVLDIDGTLLDSQGVIAPATREALRRVMTHGVGVTLATGRRLATALPQIEGLDIKLPVILQSGAQIADPVSKQMLYSNPLPPSEAAMAVRIAIAEGVQPILYENRVAGQCLFTGPPEHDSRAMRQYMDGRPNIVRCRSYDNLPLVEAPLELAVIDDLAVVRRVAACLHLAHCRTLISYSANLDSYFLEVFHATCSKGEALRHLVAHLGLSLRETVAVGDNYNDREMLEMAGLGVAMANAEPEILAIAGRVTRSNEEDGIAALIDDLWG